MSFLYRTNKGRVVYNRRPKPFRVRDVVRITNQIVEELSEQELEILVQTLTTIVVDASRVRFGAAASLGIVRLMLRTSFNYVLGELNWEVIEILRLIYPEAQAFLEVLEGYIQWITKDRSIKEGNQHG